MRHLRGPSTLPRGSDATSPTTAATQTAHWPFTESPERGLSGLRIPVRRVARTNIQGASMRRILLIAVALAAGLVFVVAAPGHAASRATVKTTHGKLGTFLVGPNGRTLYLFEADKSTKSTCY